MIFGDWGLEVNIFFENNPKGKDKKSILKISKCVYISIKEIKINITNLIILLYLM